jgi:hypothetical protein
MLIIVTGPVVLPRMTIATRLLALGCVVLGLLGAFAFSPPASTVNGVNATELEYFSHVSRWAILGTFGVFAGLIYTGAALYQVISPRHGQLLTSVQRRHERVQIPGTVLWFVTVDVALIVAGTGPMYVLNAPNYLAASGPTSFKIVGTALAPVAVITCALVAFDSEASKSTKRAAVALLAVLELLQLGAATRAFALFPVLIFVGAWLAGKRGKIRLGAAAAFALSIILLGIPLGLRALPEHGLIPALHYLTTSPGRFFSGQSNPIYNILFGVPLTMYVGSQLPPIGSHALWTSITPAPSGWTDWAALSPTLRLNVYEPYPALGELVNHGWVTSALYLVTLAAVFEAAASIAANTRGRYGAGMQALVVGSAAFVLIRATQYNLRNETRLVYYMIAGVVALAISARLLPGRKRRRATPTRAGGPGKEPERGHCDADTLVPGPAPRDGSGDYTSSPPAKTDDDRGIASG